MFSYFMDVKMIDIRMICIFFKMFLFIHSFHMYMLDKKYKN